MTSFYLLPGFSLRRPCMPGPYNHHRNGRGEACLARGIYNAKSEALGTVIMTRREFIGSTAMIPATRANTTTPVIVDHDGGFPDDYTALALAVSIPSVRVTGVVVTPADCYIDSAIRGTRKLLAALGRRDVAIAQSKVRGVHSFPDEYRRASLEMDKLPMLDRAAGKPRPLAREEGSRFLVSQLKRSGATLLVTGPLSTIAAALDLDPSIEKKIREIVWMGGAIDVGGNVEQPGHDGSAEWNAYWDPTAAARVWRTKIPIVLVPLDCTNQAPVDPEFVRKLETGNSFPARFAAECYRRVLDQKGFLWDLVAAAYLGRPSLFETRERPVQIVVEGNSQGRTKSDPNGRMIRVCEKVNRAAFYEFLMSCWR